MKIRQASLRASSIVFPSETKNRANYMPQLGTSKEQLTGSYDPNNAAQPNKLYHTLRYHDSNIKPSTA